MLLKTIRCFVVGVQQAGKKDLMFFIESNAQAACSDNWFRWIMEMVKASERERKGYFCIVGEAKFQKFAALMNFKIKGMLK